MSELVDPQAGEIKARHAYEIARAAQAKAMRDKWRLVLELPSEDDIPTHEIERNNYRACLMELMNIAQGNASVEVVTSEGDVVTKPVSMGHRLRAMELVLKLKVDMDRLDAERNGGVKPQPQLHMHVGQQSAAPTAVITREEAIAELQRRRREQLMGGHA